MILEAMKGAFDNVNHIHEQCEILDIFYSMSERSRVKSAYYQRADTVTSMLKEELARLMHGTSTRYRFTDFFPVLFLGKILWICMAGPKHSALILDLTSQRTH